MIKNNKEKVFELKIQEDDEVSGIDSISLVDEPAIEINWVAFKKEKEHEFHIPDGEDELYLNKLMSVSQDEQELFDEGWVVSKMTILGQDEFYSTDPNAPSEEDEKEYNVRYKYVLNPRITGQSSVIPTTRDFCRTLVNQNRVWRLEDMDAVSNDFGDSALVWRGGFNCRHVWARMEYRKDATIINKASVNKGKIDPQAPIDPRVLGMEEPNTVTNKTLGNPSPSTIKNLGLSKEKLAEDCPAATQDVAINLKNRQECIDVAHYGPLNPNEPNEEYWIAKAKMFGGDIESSKKALCGNCAFFVQTKSMLDCIAGGINDTNEWDTIDAGDLGYCEAFDFKCAASRTCDAWVVGGPIVEENMESVSDYPDSVKNNAKAVLKYVEENGWGSCGTEVGKIRANQLANGEPISEDTIKRMYSYLSRHKGDLDSSKGYGDGCGKLMYDSWGGLSALSWAESKIKSFGYDVSTLPAYVDELPKKKPTPKAINANSLQNEGMSKQRFATDTEKHIVLGPAMVPEQKIFRKDALGNPYYVFFTSDTIKMIAEKYMKNKYTDNNDTMHDGKAIKDIHVVESWIKESNNDKSTDFGYGDLPKGTWFVSMKVNNPEVWKRIKEGELNGFSVSGYFEEVAAFSKEEMFLYKVAEVIKNIKD
jgi:hypothetical protein